MKCLHYPGRDHLLAGSGGDPTRQIDLFVEGWSCLTISAISD